MAVLVKCMEQLSFSFQGHNGVSSSPLFNFAIRWGIRRSSANHCQCPRVTRNTVWNHWPSLWLRFKFVMWTVYVLAGIIYIWILGCGCEISRYVSWTAVPVPSTQAASVLFQLISCNGLLFISCLSMELRMLRWLNENKRDSSRSPKSLYFM